MLDNKLIEELKNTINDVRKDIILKQEKLDDLIEQYQQLSGIDLEQEELDNINSES